MTPKNVPGPDDQPIWKEVGIAVRVNFLPIQGMMRGRADLAGPVRGVIRVKPDKIHVLWSTMRPGCIAFPPALAEVGAVPGVWEAHTAQGTASRKNNDSGGICWLGGERMGRIDWNALRLYWFGTDGLRVIAKCIVITYVALLMYAFANYYGDPAVKHGRFLAGNPDELERILPNSLMFPADPFDFKRTPPQLSGEQEYALEAIAAFWRAKVFLMYLIYASPVPAFLVGVLVAQRSSTRSVSRHP